MAPATSYIVGRSIAKVYTQRREESTVLDEVNFAIEKGEFISLIGPSGCGKSTLLAMIAGLDHPTRGSLQINGGSAASGGTNPIGVMFQDATLLPWKSALENVLFPVKIARLDAARYRPKAMALLEMAGLGGSAGKLPTEMSGGMRQRVALCRSLIMDPELLLMDEPFSALDAITRDEMGEQLLRIWEKTRKTTIFVTHSIPEAVLLSDRILVMGGRPSRITEDIRVELPRPRDPHVARSSRFVDLCDHLKSAIRSH